MRSPENQTRQKTGKLFWKQETVVGTRNGMSIVCIGVWGPHRGHCEGCVLGLSVLSLLVTEGKGMII